MSRNHGGARNRPSRHADHGRASWSARSARASPPCCGNLLQRTFSHAENLPPELGCHEDESLAIHGTPLGGATLLHMCIDYGEMEIAQWLLHRGIDVNVCAATDADGFGGHTPIFSAVVSFAS